MNMDEFKKRFKLVDERGENLFKRYPVVAWCLVILVAVIAFTAGYFVGKP